MERSDERDISCPKQMALHQQLLSLPPEARDARVDKFTQERTIYNQALASTAVYLMRDPETDAVSIPSR